MSFDAFKQSVNRTTTSILQKAGAVDRTVDKEFEENERRLKGLETKCLGLFKEGKAYLDAMRAMNLAQTRISETMTSFFDESAALGLCGLKYKDAIAVLDTDIRQFTDATFRTTVLEPLDRFNSIFTDVHEAIKRRNNKQLDYDALRTKVRNLTEKPVNDASKLPRAEQMAIAAKEAFETANQQLKDEIPKLVESRVPYLDPSFEALIKLQLDYYARSYQTLLPLQSYFGPDTGGDLNARMQDTLQRMRDLTIVKASPPPAKNRLSLAN